MRVETCKRSSSGVTGESGVERRRENYGGDHSAENLQSFGTEIEQVG